MFCQGVRNRARNTLVLTEKNNFRAMPGPDGAMLANRLTAMAIFSLSV
jgi:hypothetical protein